MRRPGLRARAEAPACEGGRIAAGAGMVVFGKGPVLCVLRDGQPEIAEIALGKVGRLSALAVSPTSNLAALGYQDGTSMLIDLAKRSVTPIDAVHQGPVTALTFARDAPILLTGSLDRTGMLVDLVSHRAILLLGR